MKRIAAALTILSLFVTPAVAAEFGFADETTALPAGVHPSEVLTIATERTGDHVEGVILLTEGRVIRFTQRASAPLANRPAPQDLFAYLGK